MKHTSRLTALLALASMLSNCSHGPQKLERSTASERYHHHHYDGPIIDLDRRMADRVPSPLAFCEKYQRDTARHALACAFGIDEAQKMAQGFAGGHGREEGYVRGYAWGMNKFARLYENDPQEMNLGEMEAEHFFRTYASRAQSDGANPGARDGESLGSAEAKGRFHAAVDSQKFPSQDITIPSTSYPGVSNAYRLHVGALPSAEDYLRDHTRRLRVFDSVDRTYMNHRHRKERSARDIWTHDGHYPSDHRRFMDPQLAFELWLELSTPGKYRFERLNLEAPAPKPPTDPKDPKDPKDPTKVTVVDYQVIFKEAFIEAYRHFAPHFYARAYYFHVDDGQREGEAMGESIGREIARKKGLARGFDLRYQNASRNAYLQNFAHHYTKGFTASFNYYKDNTILSLNFMSLIGREDDGIIEPGEEFQVKFKVTNVGGKASTLKYSVDGDVEEAQTFADQIAGLSSRTIKSEVIAQVNSRLSNGDEAKIALNVNGVREQKWQRIQQPVEIYQVTPTLSMLTGSGLFNVILNNQRSVALNGSIVLELKINGVVTKTVAAEAMNAHEKKSYTLDFKGLDPLKWINGVIPVEIVLKYNDVVFASKASKLSGDGDMVALLNYLDLIANDKAIVPHGTTRQERLEEVKAMVLAANGREVEFQVDNKGNVYRTDPQTTIPGKILQVKNARSEQSPQALTFYTSLADAMAPLAKKFKAIIFIHPKRDAYKHLLGQIGGKKY